jgi:hypothetical protein
MCKTKDVCNPWGMWLESVLGPDHRGEDEGVVRGKTGGRSTTYEKTLSTQGLGPNPEQQRASVCF